MGKVSTGYRIRAESLLDPLSSRSWRSSINASVPRDSCEFLQLHPELHFQVTLQCRQVPSIKRGFSFYVDLAGELQRDSSVDSRCALLCLVHLQPYELEALLLDLGPRQGPQGRCGG